MTHHRTGAELAARRSARGHAQAEFWRNPQPQIPPRFLVAGPCCCIVDRRHDTCACLRCARLRRV